jgi:hypothetical protein
MPHEQKFGAPPAQPASDRPSAAAPDLVSDAAAAFAAIGRMEATIRSDRAAFRRLRDEALAMVNAITDAKAALQAAAIKPDATSGGKAIEIGALLHDFEGRLNAMLFLVDFVCEGASAAPARELDHVPTVSDVVSRLGRGPADGDRSGVAVGAGSDEVPSVSMLGALVEALNASISTAEPTAGTASGADAASAAIAAMEPDRRGAPSEVAHPAATAPLAQPAAALPAAPEGDLLDSFARMAAIPILPPEIGTAVIFARQAEPATAPPDRGLGEGGGAQSELPVAPAAGVTPAEPDLAASPPEPREPRSPETAAATPPHDPVAPQNAMSPGEKIAQLS